MLQSIYILYYIYPYPIYIEATLYTPQGPLHMYIFVYIENYQRSYLYTDCAQKKGFRPDEKVYSPLMTLKKGFRPEEGLLR